MGDADDRQADERAVERIHSDYEHGASWLARAAVRDLARVAAAKDERAGGAEERLARVRALGQSLAQARPSMATIANAVARAWWAGASTAGGAQAQLAALREEVRTIDDGWESASAGMTNWARQAVTGAVYTLSRSGSVERTLAALAEERATSDTSDTSDTSEPLRVIISESRPGGEGVALARALASEGAQVTLIADAAVASFIEQAALVIVGADSVRADGSVVNKVGTHTLALVARAAGRPVYALAERLKITAASYPLVIEETRPEELLPAPTPGVTPRNVYFDVTPPRLIASVVTESGPVDAEGIARLAEEAERAYRSLMGS
ncbi:MAG TPA: hypothetical protein VFU60_16955 [Ktedonobacterales bacterium]|nr:hypothetical protein [Ktedonobacterales bacterium]